jgi:hypothetical protein
MQDSNTYPAAVILTDSVGLKEISRLNVTDRKTAVATAKLMLADYQNDDDRIAWTHSNPSIKHMLPNVAYLIDTLSGEMACDFIVRIKSI